MANLYIKKDESLEVSLQAHDIIGGSERFSLWAGPRLDTLDLVHTRETLCQSTPKSCGFKKLSPLLPPKDNSSTLSA